MSYVIDTKYINLMSPRLERFAWKKNNLAVCRCPICGDSKKNKSKTRFFFFEQKGKFFVKCHNCGYSTVFGKFLEQTHPSLYDEYRVENFKDNIAPILGQQQQREVAIHEPPVMEKPKFEPQNLLAGFATIRSLPTNHPARCYTDSRRIPEFEYGRLYYCEDFSVVADKLEPGKRAPKDARLLLPFFSKEKVLFAVQGRALDSSCDLRYVTVKDPRFQIPKIFGMDRLNDKVRNYCFEGPIDSLFVINSAALAGSTVDFNEFPYSTEHTVFVYDNEPRNSEILAIMAKAIGKGFKICIWPENLKYKDVNDMVLGGVKDAQKLIDDCTCQGLEAKLKFNAWRKS